MTFTSEEENIITVDDSRCIGCGACIRSCPAGAISLISSSGDRDVLKAVVSQEKCIQCGSCLKKCSHNARISRDDSSLFFEKVTDPDVALHIMIDPSIKVVFPKWKAILSWLQKSGNKIYDVSLGADICTWANLQAFSNGYQKKIISQQCPVVVSYVLKHQPVLADSLSRIQSPAGCLAYYLKRYADVSEPIWLLSPCIAKTAEARRYQTFEYNVTFDSLSRYLRLNQTELNDESFEFEIFSGVIGNLYPKCGGFKENLVLMNPELVVRAASGRDIYSRLANMAGTGDSLKPDAFDFLSCEHGCIDGSAIPQRDISELETAMDCLEININEERNKFLFRDRVSKEICKKAKWTDFTAVYEKSEPDFSDLSPAEYDKQFNILLKTNDASRNINCGACGYSTCREMCRAVYNNENVSENCVYYIREKNKLDSEGSSDIKNKLQKKSDIIVSISSKLSELMKSSPAVTQINTAMSQSTEYIRSLDKILSGLKSEVEENGITEADAEGFTNMITQVLQVLGSVQGTIEEKLRSESECSAVWEEVQLLTNKLIFIQTDLPVKKENGQNHPRTKKKPPYGNRNKNGGYSKKKK